MRRSTFAFLFLLIAASHLEAQQPSPRNELADKIVAVVGDSIILKSDVDLELLQMAQAGQDTAGAFRKIIDRRVSELLLLQAAVRDTTITTTPDQVNSEVQRDLDSRRRQFPTEQAFQQALRAAGMTYEELRSNIRQEVTGRILMRQYIQKVGSSHKPPRITDADINKYFNENRQMFGARPATITFSQLVLAPRASDSARANARKKAEEVLQKIRAGEDFETLAKQYSEDPGSRERGGDLGWFRAGDMVREFSDAVFAMRPGDISNIVESSFGFHIIKVEKSRGAERQARHILIVPTVTPDDAVRLHTYADSIAERIRAGASIDSLQKAIGDQNETSRVGPFPRDSLPQPYNAALATAVAGEVVGPLELPSSNGASKFAIVRVTETQPAGEYTLDDPRLRDNIRDMLNQNALVDELIADLKKRTLVEIRTE
jgi:peptidyl-prolyl cis-trans isomerase SurA